jgi:hypothetical protein
MVLKSIFLLVKNGKLTGVECKRTDIPRVTPSIRNALDDLKLENIYVVYAGSKTYKIAESIHAVSFNDINSFFKILL